MTNLTKTQQKQLKNTFDNKCYHRVFDIYRTHGGLYMFNMFDRIFIDKNIDQTYYTNYTIKQNDAWTTISYQFYNIIDYWWLLYIFNNDKTTIPLNMPKAGTQIRIPTIQMINAVEQSILNELQ